MKVNLKAITPNAEVNIVEIARVSSSRIDKSEKPEGLINYLIKNKHWSPFEHSFLTFDIVTSKAIGIQLLRHRSFTFQEFSQRYSKVENLEPFDLRKQAETNRQSSTEKIGWIGVTRTLGNAIEWEKELEGCKELMEQTRDYLYNGLKLYEALLDYGVAKECARMILPMSTQTTIYMTGSVRSWIHFLDIRDDAHAQLEVQLIAKEIKRLFIEHLPIISKAKGYDNQSIQTPA